MAGTPVLTVAAGSHAPAVVVAAGTPAPAAVAATPDLARPGGGFPAPEETGDTRGRRFRQKPETKPARKTSPRRRKDDIVEPDDEY